MGLTTKLGLYAVGLVVVFAAAFGAGSVVGPVLPEGEGVHDRTTEHAPEGGPDHGDEERHE
ncbi:hypothetical protein [Nocardiopsis sp. MG754419]|uniref:hypothetical protein n=1 Tax=Nocardiopsis sp. MG754419 TaxID=2259865 RepID=UPI001BA59EF0|nr:hypothetical protein [Nocardiopsis sp. MG754419]MBR8744226.1 hypothetical protein [Nocardiopsis sp. MG754419]